MKTTLKSGSTKLLLVDEENVERNKSRAPHKAATVGRVLELADDGSVAGVYTGHTVVVKGPVELRYEPNERLTTNRSFPIMAAFVTTAEVVIDDGREEEQPAKPVSVPKKKPKAPATLKTKE